MQIQYVTPWLSFFCYETAQSLVRTTHEVSSPQILSALAKWAIMENNLNPHLSAGASIGPYKSKMHVKAPGIQRRDSFKSHKTPAPGGGSKLHSQKTDIFPKVSTVEGSQRCLAIYTLQLVSLEVRDDFITKCIMQLWHTLLCPQHVVAAESGL